MKKLSFCLSFLALLALVGVAFAQEVAEESNFNWKPDLALTLDWQSRYVSKGKVVNPDPIASVNVNVSLKGFYLNFWAPFDMTGYNNAVNLGNGVKVPYTNDRRYRAEEVDYQIGYAYTIDADNLGGLSDLTIDFSWNYWQYPRQNFNWDGSHYHDEPLALVVSLDNVLDKDSDFSLGFGTEACYDLKNYLWWGKVYGDLGYAVNEQISVGLKNTWYWGGESFNKANGQGRHDAVNAAELKLYASYALTENISLGAYFAGAWALNPTTREAWDASCPDNRRQNFWGGVSIDFCF